MHSTLQPNIPYEFGGYVGESKITFHPGLNPATIRATVSQLISARDSDRDRGRGRLSCAFMGGVKSDMVTRDCG
jgi:hypothetical protein